MLTLCLRPTPPDSTKAVWQDLSITDDNKLITHDGNRIVIPKTMRSQILEALHEPHAGIVRTKKLARYLYFWPGMNADIKAIVENCNECQVLRPSLAAEPLQPHAPADHPMSDIALDLFEYHGTHYLVMVDRYSGFSLRGTAAIPDYRCRPSSSGLLVPGLGLPKTHPVRWRTPVPFRVPRLLQRKTS